MWQPRTFIVRLYPDGTGRTAGLVEVPGSAKQFRFANQDELWALLHTPSLTKSPEARRRQAPSVKGRKRRLQEK